MVYVPIIRLNIKQSELKKLLVTLLCCLLVVIWLLIKTFNIETCLSSRSERGNSLRYDNFKLVSNYNRNTPLIFIGGVPRSGTTLMRAMLDAHPSVRCGEETRLIPRIIHSRSQWKKSHLETQRLKNAGMTDDIIDDALASFILEIVVKHGKPAPHLCNKDPLVLINTTYVKNLFPNAKFLLMIRDGRASVHSMISRHVGVGTYNLSNYEQSLTRWSDMIGNMHEQCIEAGPQSCLPVYYEQLVLHPKKIMTIILEFLGIEWNDAVLEHENFIGNEISLSKMERSTDQVIKPINTDALTSWVGHIPKDLLSRMDDIAPMLKKLGYDPTANPPNYGKPDQKIIENTKDIKMNEKYWLRIAKKYSNHVKDPNED